MGIVLQLLCFVLGLVILEKAASYPMAENGLISGNELPGKTFIPAMAKKAGGGLRRPELIQHKATSHPTYESGSKSESEFSGKNFIPAMTQKAGGSLRAEFHPRTADDQGKPEKNDKTEEEYNYDEWSNEESSEELDCPRKHFYHIRGKQCVPVQCPIGRNQMTGECKEDIHGYGMNRYGYNRGYNNEVGRSTHNALGRIAVFQVSGVRGGKKG